MLILFSKMTSIGTTGTAPSFCKLLLIMSAMFLIPPTSLIHFALLFQEKKESMSTQCLIIASKLILESTSSVINECSYDAQAVYCKLEHHAKMFTKAQLVKDYMMSDLTKSKLDSSWRGTYEGFIQMWKEKMRLFEDMTP